MPLSVCIPCYKSTDLLPATLRTVLCQTYRDIEVVICNDSPSDHDQLAAVLDGFHDPRIRFHRNDKNLGCPGNIRKCIGLARHDVVFLLCHDDLLLGNDLFEKQMRYLEAHPEVGAIARPYYWFDTDPGQPIRHTSKIKATEVDLNSSVADLTEVITATGQYSGLIFRKSLATHPVNDDVFTTHVYPFLSVARTHKIGFWPEFTIAVRASSSQTRFLSTIYRPSPTKTWMKLFHTVFPEERYARIRKAGIELLGTNYLGLAQIKNYGAMTDLLADIGNLVRYRPANLLSPKFWLFSIGAVVVPRPVLRPLVDRFKSRVMLGVYARQQLLSGVPPVAGGDAPPLRREA